MSPRVRQLSDDKLLTAAAVALRNIGPELTLADIAAESGIAPATLLQRFGSKRTLMLRLRQRQNGISDPFQEARAVHASPCEALMAALSQHAAGLPQDALQIANEVSTLCWEMRDPSFAAAAARRCRAFDEEIRGLLDEAVAWGELREVSVAPLARLLQSVFWGALLTSAIGGNGAAADEVRCAIELVLRPYMQS